MKFLITYNRFHYAGLDYIMFYPCIAWHRNSEEFSASPIKESLGIFSRGITCCAMSRRSRCISHRYPSSGVNSACSTVNDHLIITCLSISLFHLTRRKLVVRDPRRFTAQRERARSKLDAGKLTLLPQSRRGSSAARRPLFVTTSLRRKISRSDKQNKKKKKSAIVLAN